MPPVDEIAPPDAQSQTFTVLKCLRLRFCSDAEEVGEKEESQLQTSCSAAKAVGV